MSQMGQMNFQQSPNSRQRLTATPKTPTTPDIFHVSLFDEVSIMARACGDAPNQNKDAILLIERILIQQLRGMINEAMNVAFKRAESIVFSSADIEFLLRKNPAKVQRFKQFMQNIKTLYQLKVEKLHFLNRDEDDDNEEPEIFDAEKIRRLCRADRIR